MSEKPTRPEEWECCESGCAPCVWDTYYEEVREWNAAQKTIEQQSNDPPKNSY